MGYRQTQPPELAKAVRKQRRRQDTVLKPFVGVDGEGGSVRGSHEYLLLRAGDQALETGAPLEWDECFWFLSELPNDGIYVSYYFDYDVTMMVRRLPQERLERLMNRDVRIDKQKGGSRCLPVDVGPYQIDYLPRKEFRVRRRTPNNAMGRRHYTPWVTISDVGSFFQSTFVSALRKWYGEFDDSGQWHPNAGEYHMAAIIDKIAEGKDQRNAFGRITEYVREYNLLEIRALEQLMNKFRTMCHEVGLRPSKWQGPGNLVMAQFRKVGMPRNRDLTLFDEDEELQRYANAAYYGGRFEARTFGEIRGPVYQYDINSAYARTYAGLPCLLHGQWRFVRNRPTNAEIYVGLVSFSHRKRLQWYTLPVRTVKGEILFPRQARGTYWSPEIDLAVQRGADITWHGGYVYLPDCTCRVFDWVESLFEERKRLGKNGRGYVLKILLATIYGKLAQSVGTAPYANPIWAGLIVSTVRAQLCDAALSDETETGADVHMLATDGMFCSQKRSGLTVGKELGEWDLTTHDEMFVVQSGVYMLPDKDPKTRGVPQRKVIQHTWDFYVAWFTYLRTGVKPNVTVSLRSFLGIRQALARNRLDLAGQWLDVERTLTFDWNTKRRNPRVVGTAVTTDPPEGGKDLWTVPYKRTIGGGSFRELDDEQPDWSDSL